MAKPVFLSKSKLMSARQCPRRLYLEVKRPDLIEFSASTEAAFRKGHEIGDIAHKIYGTSAATFIPFEGGLKHALAKSARLLKSAEPKIIFEATLQYQGVLVRVDVMLPNGDGWDMIEVKSATSVKPEYSFDCAIQAWVIKRSGFELKSISLAYVDNQFIYGGNDEYDGLLTEESMDGDVDALLPSVPEWVAEGKAIVTGSEPDVPVGKHCFSPYECAFINYCWPNKSDYPLLGLGGGVTKKKLGDLIAAGIEDVRDVPLAQLNETQQRIHRVTVSGEAELLVGAQELVNSLEYPRYYLDFETVMPAVPFWEGTRPYQTTSFQWSCHYEESPGEIEHAEFLDVSGDYPARRFAESLIRVLGSEGPIFVYSSYEKSRINDCIRLFPELQEPLAKILERLVDLLPVTRENYYHPAMRGSWSIKAVLPTIAPELDYSEIDGISEGGAASDGYLEMIDPKTADDRKQELRQQLLNYCRIDTLALVRLVQFFASNPKV